MFWSSAPWERQASAIVGESYAGASMSLGIQVQVWKPSKPSASRLALAPLTLRRAVQGSTTVQVPPPGMPTSLP
jgi:hypothetical protein